MVRHKEVMAIKVLIVDRHETVRSGLRAIMEKHGGVEVTGEAPNGREALRLARKLKPDVVLLDLSMPDSDGLNIVRRISRDGNVRIIAFSPLTERWFVSAILEAGASGYILKSCGFTDVVPAVHSVHSGQTFISPGLADIILDNFINKESGYGLKPARYTLSERELDLLRSIAAGESNAQSASRFQLSVNTVRNYRFKIMMKLDIHSKKDLIKYALEEGLGQR